MTIQSASRLRGARAGAMWVVLACALACRREPNPEQTTERTAAPLSVTAAPTVNGLPAASEAAQRPRSVERDCDAICKHSFELKCEHAGECKTNCLAMAAVSPCQQEFVAFYRCLQGEPREHWRCDEDGVAAIREGFCEKVQAAAVGCMEHNAPH